MRITKLLIVLMLFAIMPFLSHADIAGDAITETELDTKAELDAQITDAEIVDLDDTQTLSNKTLDGNSNTLQTRRHATDCTAETGGKAGELCIELDSESLYSCQPTAGDCDTAAEWILTGDGGGGGSGDITDVGSCATGNCANEGGNDIFPFIYEGTADTFETTFQVTDPTTPDKTITFPNATGEVSLLGQTIGDAELVSNYSGIGACAANQFVDALNDNAAPTCSAIADADVPDTITASNYVLLAGDTMTGQLVSDNLGFEFTESDTNPTCAAGNYNIFADLSETAIKVCNNGTAAEVTTADNTQTLTNKTLAAANNVIDADTAVALAANPTDCAANQFADAIAASGDLTCSAIVDADVPDTITASNYLLLTGGTLTGALVLDNLGISQPASDTNPTCGAGDYKIYSDLSDTKWKKCENGSVSDLDTGGGSGDITRVGACLTSDCAIEGGNDIFPFIYEGTADGFETTFQVTDPTTPDKTITFPDATGEVSLLGQTIGDAELETDFIAETELDTKAELDTQITDATIVDESSTQTLTNKTILGDSNTIGTLTHATDCTAATGVADEFCWEIDADTWYVCEPSAGNCDTAGEWKQVNAANATQLAADPADCAANQFADAIAANGDLTCNAIVDADVPDTITASNYLLLTGGTLTGAFILDDTSLQVQEGVDTMTITVPALTAARAVTFPDAAGEVSLLGQTISDAELVTDFIAETELDTIAELNTQITDATVLTKADKQTRCFYAQDLAAADDDILMGSWFVAVTITDVWCNYQGAAPTTVAQMSLEDGSGNAMTHTTPVCAAPGTAATSQSVTAAGALTARENLRFDVDNTPNPATDEYVICVAYTID